MNVGEMIRRIVAFKTTEHGCQSLRDYDSHCAEAVNTYWANFGPFGIRPCRNSINYLFDEVDRQLALAGRGEA